MKDNIHNALNEFKTELEKLHNAVFYIDEYKKGGESIITSMSYLSKDFAGHLNKILAVFNDYSGKIKDNYYNDVSFYKAEFEKFQKSLQVYSAELKLSSENLMTIIEVPLEKFNTLTNQSELLVNKIDTINFPERLDSLEHNVNTNIADISLANKELNKQSLQLIKDIGSIKFSEQFENLKSTVNETVSEFELLIQSLTENQQKLSQVQHDNILNLAKDIENIQIPCIISNLQKDFQKNTEDIKNSNSQLNQRNEKLFKYLEDINISLRLDKIDATIAGIIQSIQSVLQRIETLERNIKDTIQNETKELINKIEKTETALKDNQKSNTEELKKQIESLENKLNTNSTTNYKSILTEFEQVKKQNNTLKILVIFAIAVSLLCLIFKFVKI